MAVQLTEARRRVVAEADPETGLLHGRTAVLEALVTLGLAVRHQRPPRRCYLTPAGWRLHERLLAEPGGEGTAEEGPPPASAGEEGAGVFAARTGDEAEPADPETRAREVRSAWEGLVDLRRLTSRTGDTLLPCPWERGHAVAAAGLALEAAGCRPSAVEEETGRRTVGGYRVEEWPQEDTVRVARADRDGEGGSGGEIPDDLGAYARALERAGWQTSVHTDRRGGAFLLASVRRA